jgi:predicted ATPase
MLTLELAMAKIHQLTPEQREEVIKFIEFIDYKYNQQITEKNQAKNDIDDTPLRS